MLVGACARDNPAYEVDLVDGGERLEVSPGQEAGDDVPPPDGSRDLGAGDAEIRWDAPAPDVAADVAPNVAVEAPPDIAGDVITTSDAPDFGAPAPGVVLHWRLDEASGTVAADSSSSGFNGNYVGNPVPIATPGGAPTYFPNPASREFRATVSHSVQLGNTAAALQPTGGVTVSIWFRTTLAGRADLVTHAGDYFIRIMSGELEFVRRRPSGSADVYITATGPAGGATDGNWHHALGVATTSSIAMYLDGVLIARKDEVVPFVYAGRSLTLGRSASGGLPFEGWLDDLRIYNRALGEDEIRALAGGAP